MLEMSASDSWVDFAIRRRSFPTRRVRITKIGISANAKSASCQLSSSIPIIVATTVVKLDAMLVAVLVTTFWMPPMSLLIRDCTSPVRVRVKKASESRCRWRKTAARRSCITRCPTWFEKSVWTTVRTPETIAITIIAAALTETARVSWLSIATRTRRSRNAGTTPRPALATISARSTESRRQYGLKSEPIRRRFARRTSGSIGRSGGAWPRSWKNMPIRRSRASGSGSSRQRARSRRR